MCVHARGEKRKAKVAKEDEEANASRTWSREEWDEYLKTGQPAES